MKHIDKNNAVNKFIGDRIVNEYIANQRTIGYDYSYFLFGKTPYKNQLRDVLIDEQQGLCCYCMRQLYKDETTTMEHIIPKSSSIDEFDRYKSNHPSYFTEVVHLSRFTHSSSTPPFPHSVAYQNLAASCKGVLTENSNTACCCNNKREHGFIVPIILDPNVASLIEYFEMSGAIISSSNDPCIGDTIATLGLNDRTLKEIRVLWALVAKKCISIRPKGDRRELTKAFNTDLISNTPLQYRKYIENDYYWNLFISYNWFMRYYNNKNAS